MGRNGLFGMYIYIYVLQKMIHGPSNVKFNDLFVTGALHLSSVSNVKFVQH